MEFGNMYSAGATDPQDVVERARARGLQHQEFDSFVGTGLSGALVIPTLAHAFDKQWAIIRKQGDNAHSSSKIEGSIGERWVFVDDLIDRGTTLAAVHDKVCEAFRGPFDEWGIGRPDHGTTFAGAFLYQDVGRWLSPVEVQRRMERYSERKRWQLQLSEVWPEARPSTYYDRVTHEDVYGKAWFEDVPVRVLPQHTWA